MIETLQVPLLLVASKGADSERVASVAAATGAKIAEGAPDGALALRLDEDGLSLERDGMVLRGDFADMLPRLKQANLSRELLVRAAKIKGAVSPTAVDATAGMGQDSLLLAAAGFTVTMFESDPVIAALLQDAGPRRNRSPPGGARRPHDAGTRGQHRGASHDLPRARCGLSRSHVPRAHQERRG